MVQNYRRTLLLGILVALTAGAFACQPPASEPIIADESQADTSGVGAASSSISAALPLPALHTYADTVALRVYEAAGGPAAWHALRYLRFNYALQRLQERRNVIRHLWDRWTGAYRVEIPGPANEPYVILFNVNTREGYAYWQGAALDSTESPLRQEEGHRRFINDTYWLTAPFKLFDPGVQRTYVPDSSDATYDVLYLRFNDVGLTSGDQYWLYVDKETGRLARWSYLLESDRPGSQPRSFVWEAYEEHLTAAGPLYFATRKRGVGTPFAILTDGIETPTLVPEDVFTAPEARLTPTGSDTE